MKYSKILLVFAVLALVSSLTFATSEPLGTANKYNIFVINDMIHTGGDSEGAVAVGGNSTMSSYGAGNELAPGGNADGYGMVIGGNLNFSNSQSYHGDVHVGGTATISNATINDGTLVNPSSPIDFAAEETHLLNLSDYWKNLPANGIFTLRTWGRLEMIGTSSDLNVFYLDAYAWKLTKEVAFYVPVGSKVIVNVAGTPDDHGSLGSIFMNNASNTKTVWNFFEATNLEIKNISWQGTILAPKADFTYQSAQIEGNLVVKSCTMTNYSGEVHNYPLDGNFPKPGTPPSVQAVVPQLECVEINSNGTYTAHFTYDNPNSSSVNVPVGADNFFTPAPANRGQVTTFVASNNATYPNANFDVTWDGTTDLTWTLNGTSVTASAANSPFCSEQVFFDKTWFDASGTVMNNPPANLPANYKIEVTSQFGTAVGTYNGNTLQWIYDNTPAFADNNGLWVPVNGAYVVHEYNLPSDYSEFAGTGSFTAELNSGYATNPYNGNDLYALHIVKNKENPVSNATGAVINLGADSTICQHSVDSVTVTGTLDITPEPAFAELHTTWQLLYPDSVTNDNSVNYFNVSVLNDTVFTITGYWPGVTATDSLVKVKFTATAKDNNGNVLAGPVTKFVYWDANVCPPPAQEEADLRLSKSVNTQNAENGDNVTYSIELVNDGPKAAPNVVVSDLLPQGLDYVSSSATQGTYDTTNGLWTVGNVANGATETLTLTAKIDLDSLSTSALDLGPASDFNVFILKDINQPSADTEGKMAVGRNAELNNYSIGDKLTTFGEDVLIVGNNLTYHSGRVFQGNVVYGNSTNLPVNVTSVDGTISQGMPIDFTAAETYLKNLSTQLAAMTVNGTTTYEWSTLSLNGTDPFMNVFEVKGSEMTSATDFRVSVPNGAVALINVKGNNIVWNGGLNISGTDKSNVMFNFYNAGKITISNIDVRGSILAPNARIKFISGVQNGQMIAKFLEGSAQFNNTKFIGNIPADTSFTNVAEVFASDIDDPDSDPGNGDTNEDDYDFAVVYVNNYGGTGSGGSGGSGGSSATWTNVGTFGSNEIVYVVTKDNNDDLLVGTWGGTIRRSTDDGASWKAINDGMNVAYIWSIAADASLGYLYVATEQGVFLSPDNGTTWNNTNLSGIDVRSIAVDANGTLYAGTWGLGMYKSLDNGVTWVAINQGIAHLAVNAVVVDGNGDLFAGTFAGGVYKSVDQGANWIQLPIGYEHVWSLGVTSTNELYAGTYGAGVYKSTNGGNSWSAANGNLSASYIYAITIDDNDIVYISTWSNGVYSSTNTGLNWQTFGLVGSNVSTIYTGGNTSKATEVYAGTSTGEILKLDNPATDVETEVVEVPVEFALEQNYPNPFNPATTIQYSIKDAGEYSLRIYNILGQQVLTLVNGQIDAGTHKINFNASRLSSGIYFYQLAGKNVNITKKMVLLK